MTYFEDMYPRLFMILLVGGWTTYTVAFFITLVWIYNLRKNDEHKASKRYYGIILSILFFIIGMLITVFLPSPEYFGIK